MSTCRACPAAVTFLKTSTGSWMLVDGIHPKGTIFDPKVHVSHFATCPDPARFRKRERVHGDQSNRS